MTAQNLPAMVDEWGTGLEDIEDEVGALPRITILHKKGVFVDTLTGEEFAKVVGVPLGIIKQRVMWDSDVEEGKKLPLCKSNNGKSGYPNAESEKNGGFPWSDAPTLNKATASKDEHDRIVLSCEGCPFAEWGKDPKNGKAKPPPCKERYTIPIIYNREGTSYEPPYMDSGILGFQGSGIKPTRMYASAFIRGKLPLYAAVVEITLEMATRGAVDYSFPVFKKLGPVPESDWEQFGKELGPLREYLTRPPRPSDDESGPANGHGQTAAQAAKNAGVTASAPAAKASDTIEGEVESESPWSTSSAGPVPDDDEIPF